MTEELIDFIEDHALADTNRLLLDAAHYPGMDMPFIVEQIVSRRKIKDKLPSWYANKALLFPSSLSVEQCSSELTAGYKMSLIRSDEHVCDLTGGLGVDAYAFSQKANRVTYVERLEHYADVAKTNFSTLGAKNIRVIHGDGMKVSDELKDVDTFYIDPARRGVGDRRVFALSDCEPDLTVMLPHLLNLASRVIAKISPMADINHTLALLPETTEVHVLSVRNECKELLFVIERGKKEKTIPIICANLIPEKETVGFVFTMQEEQTALPVYSSNLESYLFEPNASLLKAGAFKVLANRYPVRKLQVNSHLYTSDILIDDFPGRKFLVDVVYSFSSSLIKRIAKELPQANITVRHFPLSAEQLRLKTKIKDGGDIYLFATTLCNGERVLIKTRKV